MVDNRVEQISNYNTSYLQEVLTDYGNAGYKLVNAVIVKNRYHVDVLDLFFTKEITEDDEIMQTHNPAGGIDPCELDLDFDLEDDW